MSDPVASGSGVPDDLSSHRSARPSGRAWRPSEILPPLVVVFAILSVVLGGYVVAAALSEPAGPPVTVGGVVRVAPLSGWELSRRFTDPLGVRFMRGSGDLDVLVVPIGGDANTVARWYVARYLEPTAVRLSVSPTTVPVRLESGLEGVRLHYIGLFGGGGVSVEGEVTAFASGKGTGVVFDAWAARGLLQYVVNDTRDMIEDAVVT